MMPAPTVLALIGTIMKMIPSLYQWSVEITDDTGVAVPAEFRIYVDGEAERVSLRETLCLGRPAEQTDTTETHKFAKSVLITIIEV
jgi:hypothetical protein